jgi:hypothetical protein
VPMGVGPRLCWKWTSEKAKFALIEYSEIRLRQDSYSLLHEP